MFITDVLVSPSFCMSLFVWYLVGAITAVDQPSAGGDSLDQIRGSF